MASSRKRSCADRALDEKDERIKVLETNMRDAIETIKKLRLRVINRDQKMTQVRCIITKMLGYQQQSAVNSTHLTKEMLEVICEADKFYDDQQLESILQSGRDVAGVLKGHKDEAVFYEAVAAGDPGIDIDDPVMQRKFTV